MSALRNDYQEFLSQVDELEHPGNEQKIRAVDELIKKLINGKMYMRYTDEELESVVGRLQKVRERLEEIDQKLKLSIKSGIYSDSIH